MSVCTPWTDEASIAKCCESGCDADEMITAASEILYVLSGRQFPGICEAVLRPCGPYECSCSCGHRFIQADGYYWRLSGGCCCPSEILLKPGPAVEVTEVLIDGEVVTDYRLDFGGRLVRLPDSDGNSQGWPCCQRLDLEPTEDNTFQITYNYGQDPPQSGINAATVLACELGKACSGASDCRLPQRVTQLTRQGVTVTLLDPQDFLDKGRVGLYEVDLFLKTYNPNGLDRPAAIYNPDTFRQPRRVS